MKHLFSTLLFLSGMQGYAQTIITTNEPGRWSVSETLFCSPAPLAAAQISGLDFTSTALSGCNNIQPATGNAPITPSAACSYPDSSAYLFRVRDKFESKPCLATYSLRASNAFRIYVNNKSSSTNILPGSPAGQPSNGVCGDLYTGNDPKAEYTGLLDISDFSTGINQVDFEVTNGDASNENQPLWLSGNLMLWQHSDLKPFSNVSFSPDSNFIEVSYPITQDAKAALFSVLIEYSEGFPDTNWITHYSHTGTKKQFRFQPNTFKLPYICDGNGAGVRATFVAMAGQCKTSIIAITGCSPFSGEVEERTVYSDGSTNNFVLTAEQILLLQEEYLEHLSSDEASLFQQASASTADQSQLKIFPNPSAGRITVALDTNSGEPTPLKIFNQLGSVVLETLMQNGQEIDLSRFPEGIYYVKTFEQNHKTIKSARFVLRR
jgi:hypothetical protein